MIEAMMIPAITPSLNIPDDDCDVIGDVAYVTGLEWLLVPTSLTACSVTLLCELLESWSVVKSNDVIPLAMIVSVKTVSELLTVTM